MHGRLEGKPVSELPNWRKLVLLFTSFFGLILGLCALIAVVVTVAGAFQDHSHAHWPETTARIRGCDLEVSRQEPESYRIDCNVTLALGSQVIASHVFSHDTPAPNRVLWQYPPRQFQKLQVWVKGHPEGTLMVVHYNPSNPKELALVQTDMPLSGPSTPGNLSLLGLAASGCLLLLGFARFARG